jgi:spermidine synthase/uncharacterized membrane protein YqaE (UPF0057 family)
MVLEMAGSRVVAPYMGTSLVVWTSLIGVIMISLTLGYWLGGAAADRRPDRGFLSNIIGAAAVVTVVVGFVANPLLSVLSAGVRNIYVASVIASALLFAIPSALLGMVSPFIVRLAMRSVVSSGGTVGRFSAMSSAGSILGTFLGGFVLISFFSSRTILFIVAFVLGVVAVLLRGGMSKAISIFIALVSFGFCFLSESAVDGPSEVRTVFMKPEGITIDTRYNTIRIMERTALGTNLKIRVLQTDPMGAQSLMFVDKPNDLYSDYTKFYDLAFHYKADVKKVLMLGGGGYCVPKHITETRPDVAVDIVELDPGITEAARAYFNLTDRPGQRIFHEDARTYLNRYAASGATDYDLIMGDTFSSVYNIPFQMSTVECAQRIHASLAADGIYIVNILSAVTGKKSLLLRGIRAGFEQVFPAVHVFPQEAWNPSRTQNIMLLACKDKNALPRPEELEKAGISPALKNSFPQQAADEFQLALNMLRNEWRIILENDLPPLYDDFAPVERYALPLTSG